jgi:hypothetical protein
VYHRPLVAQEAIAKLSNQIVLLLKKRSTKSIEIRIKTIALNDPCLILKKSIVKNPFKNEMSQLYKTRSKRFDASQI